MNNPQTMTPLETLEAMRADRNVSNELHFRNADGEVVFAVIYVLGKAPCKQVLDAFAKLSESWDTTDTETIVGKNEPRS
jgi:hypothetical protein